MYSKRITRFMRIKKEILYILFFFLGSLNMNAQHQTGTKPTGSIAINRDAEKAAMNPEEMIRNIFIKPDKNIAIENISYRILGWDASGNMIFGNNTTGIGYFNKADSDFPLREGIILSTANVLEAEGPNQKASGLSTPANQVANYLGDADLKTLVPAYSFINNVGVIEFDFTAISTSVLFKYIFASEEYPTFANNQYNDVFGFFIHEIGDESTKENIAMLQETATKTNIVSINNVNDGAWDDYNWSSQVNSNSSWDGQPRYVEKNPRYFVRQKNGTLTSEFNGYIYDKQENKPLEAVYDKLVPGRKYHIKIALANVGYEGEYRVGSGVFLEAYSFTMEQELEVIGNNVPGAEIIYANCDNNSLRIHLPVVATGNIPVKIRYSGAAVNGTHYTDLSGNPLPTTTQISTGSSYVDIPFKLTDEAVDGSSFVVEVLRQLDGEDDYVVTSTKTVKIFNGYPVFSAKTIQPCFAGDKGSIQLETVSGSSAGYEYSIDNGTTWKTDPLFTDLAEGSYTIIARDLSKCDIQYIAVDIKIAIAKVDAGPDITDCSSVFIMDALPPENGQSGSWSVISPAQGVTIANPSLYNTEVTLDLSKIQTAQLKWTISNGNCEKSDEVIITYKACAPNTIPVNPHLMSRYK